MILFIAYCARHALKIFFSARPEPVEGYPRALEETLQQVQGERKKKFWSDKQMIFVVNIYKQQLGNNVKKQFNIYVFLLCIATWHHCTKTAEQKISKKMLKAAIERKIEQSKKIYDPIHNEVLVYNNTIDYEKMRQNIRKKIAAIRVPVMFFSREGYNSYKMESYTPEQGFITLRFLEPDARDGKLTLFSLEFRGFEAKSAIFLASHADNNNATDKYVMRHIIDTFPTIGIQKEDPDNSLLPAIQETEKRGPVASYYYSNSSQLTKIKPFIRLDPATIGSFGLFIVMPITCALFLYNLLKN